MRALVAQESFDTDPRRQGAFADVFRIALKLPVLHRESRYGFFPFSIEWSLIRTSI
jgi:hypothetical protein